MSPGSMPLAEELIQEGMVIPPIRLRAQGRLNSEVLALLLRNMRAPDERQADLDAQEAAQRTGELRFRQVVERISPRRAASLAAELMAYSARMAADALRSLPDGDYRAGDVLDDDGFGSGPLPIRVVVTLKSGQMHCDFTGSASERRSPINAVAAVTRSAVYYVVRCLVEHHFGPGAVPMNAGCFRPVTLTLPDRSIVNASPPHAVSAGNVETSQRIVDVLFSALLKAAPGILPAASQGTMNNLAFGGYNPDVSGFAYYETIGGGLGASATRPGLSGAHSHMTNTMNTPIEALEMAYPVRLTEYGLRRGSGGRGANPGGDGIVRSYEFLSPLDVTLITDRRRRRPPGTRGGGPGASGRNTAVSGGRSRRLPGKTQLRALPGDRLTIETPGGGGFGRLPARPLSKR
jgi:N-methylhydantoinase B